MKLLLVLISLMVINFVSVLGANNDLSLTKQQKRTLEKFKARVLPKLETDYMKQDTYLIRWLRARNFDAERAEDMLMANVKWRKDNKMDGIHDEDWALFRSEYPYDKLYDKEGRPVNLFHIGSWDIRKAAVSGQLKKLNRWVFKIFDEATLEVIDLQRQGRNITRFVDIYDMEKLNAEQHMTVQCMPFYTTLVLGYESYFPILAEYSVLLNSPSVFETVLNLLRPIMTPDTRNGLKVYGTNRRNWEPKLREWIDTNQIPT